MKQFHITYDNDENFFGKLEDINRWCQKNTAYKMIFRIYSQDMDKEHIDHVCHILDDRMPEALYLGCTSNANIQDGSFTESELLIICTVLEYETTQALLLQYPFTEDNYKEAVDGLKQCCEENPWVKSVEMHATIMDMSMKGFCDEMSTLPKDIQVFGGGAFNPNMDDEFAGVFSKGNGFLEHGIVFLLLGGEDYHAYSRYISGWKPLKRRFRITKAEKEVLYELDGRPAFEVYKQYLNIEKNESFFSNTLEFPLFLERGEFHILRCPLAVNEDDSLIMSSDMEENAYVKIAYGDPETILHSIRQDGQMIADFQPEVIQTFSCAARRAFWGDVNISKETVMFQDVAPTAGFYTHGEFVRIDGDMLNFNVTLVIAAMREGDPKEEKKIDFTGPTFKKLDKIPMIWRFVSFIEASTAELEAMNNKLSLAAITDGLTRLYNRAEIERRINSALEQIEGTDDDKVHLIMLDIDNFKQVNDVYGHREGDQVIIALSDILLETAGNIPNSSVGRWGGEEFMVLLVGNETDAVMDIAEKIRKSFADVHFPKAGEQTVSIGVTKVKSGESVDKMCSRVDKALYKAKASGKNCVVKLG